jgi:hypothetical protein
MRQLIIIAPQSRHINLSFRLRALDFELVAWRVVLSAASAGE